MLSLHETQRAFVHAIQSGNADVMQSLLREEGIPAAQRMQIYRNNCRAGFDAALMATFPVIEKLAGADWFKQTARRYQERYPSRCGDLQYVGEHYPEFLGEDLRGSDYEYFADVAQLEWAYQEVLIAAESSPLDVAALSSIAADDYERLVFVPRTELRLVTSRFPILDIWKMNQHGADDKSCDVNFDGDEKNIVVIRCNQHVELRELPATDFALLQGFVMGASLGEITARLQLLTDFDLGASLQRLILLQAIHDVRLAAKA